MLDSGAEGPGFKSQLSGNSLRQTVHINRASVHQAAKLVAALLRVAGVTAGLSESNGSLLFTFHPTELTFLPLPQQSCSTPFSDRGVMQG